MPIDNNEQNEQVIDGIALFQDLKSVFNKYLSLSPYYAETLAIWSIFSYCIDADNIAPKLLVTSPEKRCGKTTLMDVLNGIVWKPLLASNITPAAIFRSIEAFGGTIMIDEADTFMGRSTEMTGIINSGHRKSSAFVIRLVGDKHEPHKFSTWAPMVIAMINKPADTIIDRSIILEMKRKRPNEEVEKFIASRAEGELQALAERCQKWKDQNFDALSEIDVEVSESLQDRAADNWRPLLKIAKLISEDCFSAINTASIEITAQSAKEEELPASILLLHDIQEIFINLEDQRVTTQVLLNNLWEFEDSPWAEWNRGNPITARQVAKHLKPYGIKPTKLRFGSITQRGYELKQFKDAFNRYLETDVDGSVPDRERPNSLNLNNCSAVPYNSAEGGEFSEPLFDD